MIKTHLAYIPSPPRGVWFLGNVPIRAYAVCILIGIIIAIWWSDKRWIARGGAQGQVELIAVWAVPCGIIGGRLYHVITDWRLYFGGDGLHPIDALKIWDGGLGIWGAVFLGGIGAWIGCRRLNIPLRDFADAVAPPILLAQAIGRLGNYFNQELFGRATTLPWGLEIYYRYDQGSIGYGLVNGHSTGQIYKIVQPTFLYELLWNLFFVGILLYAERAFTLHYGQVFALYISGYCFGRFFVELLRDDSAMHIFGLRINTITSSICYFVALAWFLRSRYRYSRITAESHILLRQDSSHIKFKKLKPQAEKTFEDKKLDAESISLSAVGIAEKSDILDTALVSVAQPLTVKTQSKISPYRIFSSTRNRKVPSDFSSTEVENSPEDSTFSDETNLSLSSEDEYFHDITESPKIRRTFIPHIDLTKEQKNIVQSEIQVENHILPDFAPENESHDPFAPPEYVDNFLGNDNFVLEELSVLREKNNTRVRASSSSGVSVFSFNEREKFLSVELYDENEKYTEITHRPEEEKLD